MSDSFEFTLNSPLTQEDWNKISDAELENTMSITFQTPQGRQVKYIKCEVLDKIRAEIEERKKNSGGEPNRDIAFNVCLQIIDRYTKDGE
jgi:hypothetical protein